MNKISKAIAGGLAAAAGTGTAYFMLPEGLVVPGWAYLAVPAINFVVGFVVTYFAPANATA